MQSREIFSAFLFYKTIDKRNKRWYSEYINKERVIEMLSSSDVEAKKVLIDRDLRKLEDDVAYIASIVGSLRTELDSVKTEDDAKRFDKRMDESFKKLKILQL